MAVPLAEYVAEDRGGPQGPASSGLAPVRDRRG